MPDRHSFGEIHLDVTAGREKVQAKPESETPFRVAILGDFTGRGNRKLIEIGDAMANRRPILIDRDNYDSVLAKMSPHLDLFMGGKDGYPITLKFNDWRSFIPTVFSGRSNCFRSCATHAKSQRPGDFR